MEIECKRGETVFRAADLKGDSQDIKHALRLAINNYCRTECGQTLCHLRQRIGGNKLTPEALQNIARGDIARS